jgi:hypothetical protein
MQHAGVALIRLTAQLLVSWSGSTAAQRDLIVCRKGPFVNTVTPALRNSDLFGKRTSRGAAQNQTLILTSRRRAEG